MMSAPTIAQPGSVQRNTETNNPSHQDITSLAYALWQQRGAPPGSSDQDWEEAERQLRSRSGTTTNPGRR